MSATNIVSEGGHYYITFVDRVNPTWNNLLDYIEIQAKTPVNEELVFMDVLDNILMTEFNCKWVRDKKKNYLKFYSAKELEYFLLRFT